MKQSKGITVLAKGVASCPAQATAYGKCIASSYKDVQKDMCQKEFAAFKSCVQQVVSIINFILFPAYSLFIFLRLVKEKMVDQDSFL